MRHPWRSSSAGDQAAAARTFVLPADWSGPVVLQFYAADDYEATDVPDLASIPDYVSVDAFVGHRFKEVLIDDEIVWARDVADGLRPAYFEVDLTDRVRPGTSHVLMVRVRDRVGSAEAMPGDAHIGYTWDPTRAPFRLTENRTAQTDASFRTTIYWGDLGFINELDRANAFVPPPPSITLPMSEPVPDSARCDSSPVALTLSSPPLPITGYPVSAGVPFARGQVRDPHVVRILGESGRTVPTQIEPLGLWPDGSVKFALASFIALPEENYSLSCASDPVPGFASSLLHVVEQNGSVAVDTGGIAFAVHGQGSHPIDGDTVVLDESGTEAQFVGDRAVVVRRGPIRATVRIDGHIEGPAGNVGRATLRADAYVGMPFYELTLRVFNDTDRTLNVQDLRLDVPGNFGVATSPDALGSLGLPVRVVQSSAGAFSVSAEGGSRTAATGAHAEGWLLARSQKDDTSLLVAVRHFHQLFPKAIDAEPDVVRVHLALATGGIAGYQPTAGEAITHEILVGRPAATAAAPYAALFEQPPRPYAAPYFAQTGALGAAETHDSGHFRAFDACVRPAILRQIDEKTGAVALGIRDYPDSFSSMKVGALVDSWLNFYQVVVHSLAMEYAMTGDRRLADTAEAAARNYADVDVIHGSRDHPAWVGLPHAYGSNHTGEPPSPLASDLNGLVDLYFLTGEPDYWETALGIGDGIMRDGFGHEAASARFQGWPLYNLGRLYRETRDPKFLPYMKDLVDLVAKYVDPRRGTYDEGSGSIDYVGVSPFMDAILASGLALAVEDARDERAARFLVQIAESVLAEDQPPSGAVATAPNPHTEGEFVGYPFAVSAMYLSAYALSGAPQLLSAGIATRNYGLRACAQRLSMDWENGTLLRLLRRYDPDGG